MARLWVYIWKHKRGGTGASWGHSSVQIEGGPYISWWPDLSEDPVYAVDKTRHPMLAGFMKKFIGTTNVYKVKHRCNPSLQHDVEAERKPAKYCIAVADGVLDTAAIARWWHGYQYENASFHVIKKNCSTTVIRALRAGGSDKHVSGIQGPDFLSKRKGWEPTDILAYMKNMNRKLGDERVNLLGSVHIPPPGNQPQEDGGGVEMCEEHGQPLLTCNAC